MLFASLLALQYVRTPDRIEEQRFPADALKAAGGSHPVPKDTIRGFLEERWGYPPQESEVQGAWDFVNYVLRDGQQMTNAEYLQATFGTLPALADRLAAMRWSTEVTKGGHYLTSDQPLVLWLKDPSPFRGAGIDGADEIRFPVGSRHLLVLRRTGRELATLVIRARVAAVNRHVAATCRHMVIAGREQAALLEYLPLKARRPMWGIYEGPLYNRGANGDRYAGEVIQLYAPTTTGRWTSIQPRQADPDTQNGVE